MKLLQLSRLAVFLVVGACTPEATAPDPAPDAAADRATIRVFVDKYVESVELADTALVDEVWLDSPEVSFIHPGGHEVGLAAIKTNVIDGAMGGLFSARDLTLGTVGVHLFGDTAVAEFEWTFDATWKKDGSAFQSEGRESQIYRRGQDGWALVHVHYSGAPVTDQDEAF